MEVIEKISVDLMLENPTIGVRIKHNGEYTHWRRKCSQRLCEAISVQM